MVRVLLTILFCALLGAFAWWILRQRSAVVVEPPPRLEFNASIPSIHTDTSPTPETPNASVGSEVPTPQETPEQVRPNLNQSYAGELKLIIPVAGVGKEQLIDTFDDARSEGRVHDAIDIPAPGGTPVLAAADGRIVKLFQSEKGGITIYELGNDEKLVFYYAHLQRYADGIVAGQMVRQGELLAYVGDTGNAGPGNYHLHFSISVVSDPKRYWEGTNINPFPLLRR